MYKYIYECTCHDEYIHAHTHIHEHTFISLVCDVCTYIHAYMHTCIHAHILDLLDFVLVVCTSGCSAVGWILRHCRSAQILLLRVKSGWRRLHQCAELIPMKSSSSLRFRNDGMATLSDGNATVMRQSVQVHICTYVARKYIHTGLARAYILQNKKACRLINEVLLLNVSVSACKCQLEAWACVRDSYTCSSSDTSTARE